MNAFVLLNANKEIMSLKLQTDYLCPRVDGISTIPTPAKPICMDLPCDSQKIQKISFLATSLSHMVTAGSFCMTVGTMATDQTFLTKKITKTS